MIGNYVSVRHTKQTDCLSILPGHNIEKYGRCFIRIRKEILDCSDISLDVAEVGGGFLVTFTNREGVNEGASGVLKYVRLKPKSFFLFIEATGKPKRIAGNTNIIVCAPKPSENNILYKLKSPGRIAVLYIWLSATPLKITVLNNFKFNGYKGLLV